jgi:hypothetical protein
MKLFTCTILSSVILIFYSCVSSPPKNIVEVTARHYRFEMPDSIPCGWTTFKLKNMDSCEHFMYISLIPDSISFDTYHLKVSRPFDIIFDSIKAGKSKAEAGAMFGKLFPSWFFTDVKVMGGTGIISSGKTAVTTIKLIPGKYEVECYIKMNGVFHSSMGMHHALYVTNDSISAIPPDANVDITLLSDTIETTSEIKSGSNTIAVHYKEHPEIGLGNDVHLIKMNNSTDIDSVAQWMDWMNVKGLETPAPVEFLGGVQEMPIGYTSYFTADLEPGDYAWITETSPVKYKMFTVK